MTESAPETPSSWTFIRGLARDWGIAALVVATIFLGYNLLFPTRPPGLGPAPDFTLANLEGEQITLSSVASDSGLVVLNFWFTTCPPCRAEIPELTAFAKDNPDIQLYGVSTDVNMPPGRLKRQSHQLGIRYPVLHDVRADVARLYGVNVFPTTLVIRDMQIVRARVGILNREQLDEMVAAAR